MLMMMMMMEDLLNMLNMKYEDMMPKKWIFSGTRRPAKQLMLTQLV